MLGHVGEEFNGVISGVTAFGMFVELANGVEGLVHISSLTDDYYEFFEEKYALLGTHTHKSYRLGDTVRIEVLQVNVAERSIDFIMAGENEAMRDFIRQRLTASRHQRSGKSGGSTGHAPALPDEKQSQPHHKKQQKGDRGKPKFAKRGKGGSGGNKYLNQTHGNKRKHRRH